MDGRQLGWLLVLLGALIVAAGFLLASGWMQWFGRLPGDIRIVSKSTRIYIPLTSMLLTSVVLTLLLNLFRRLW